MTKYMTAALLGLAILAGCQKVEDNYITEEPQAEELEGLYTLTVQASKGVDTKSLSLDGNTLNAHWTNDDKAAVFLSGNQMGLLQASVDGMDDTKALLSGALTSVAGITHNTELKLLFPRPEWNYMGQDGLVATIGTQYDYAMATITVDNVNTGNKTLTTATTANFENQQSVYRFGFKVGGSTPLSVKEFTVSSNHNKLVRTRSWSNGWVSTYGALTVKPASASSELLYLSLRNENTNTAEADKFSFYVIGADNALYVGEKDIPGDILGNGKFISAQNVSVSKSDLAKSGSPATEVW